MTTPVFQPGYSAATTFKVDGGAAVTLNVTAWSWEEEVVKLVTTHTGSGGLQALIAGILSGEGTVEANYDSANPVHAAAPGVIAGAKGTLTVAVGNTNPFSIHVMVTKLNFKMAIAGLITYNFNASLDSSSGAYTRAS